MDGALLLLALAAVAFSVVSVYTLEVSYRLLLAGAAVLALAALVIMSLPRYKLILTVTALGLWSWGMRWLWEKVQWGGAKVWCGVVNTLARKVPGITPIVPVAEYSDAVWAMLVLLWLLMAGVVYALALGFLICRVRRFLPVFLLTLLPILPALCVTEAPAPAPMGAFLALWLAMGLTSLAEKRDPGGAARLRPMALGAGALAAAVLLHVLPTQGTVQPQWAAQARADAYTAAGRWDLSSFLSGLGLRGWTGSGSTEYVSLTGGGASRTGKTALRVHTTAPGKHYLRGYSADVYTGYRWEPLSRTDRREMEDILAQRGQEPLLALGEAVKNSRDRQIYLFSSSSYTYSPTEEEAEPAVMEIENVSAPGGCVYYPYALAAVPEGAASEGDSHLGRDWQVWEHEISYYPEYEYLPLWTSFRQQELGEDPYRDFVYVHELQVPEALREMLLDWLDEAGQDEVLGIHSPEEYAQVYKWISSAPDSGYYGDEDYEDILERKPWAAVEVTQEEVEELRQFYVYMMINLVDALLEQETTYDMDTPAPPVGEDYVNWFLNGSRRGYCMHYATAAALLLRSVGVPARYVSGYVVNVPATGYAVVPDTAAHAWVEVYLDGYGWYPIDVTPGFEGESTGENEPGDFDPGAEATPAPTPTPEASATPSATPSAAPSAAPSQAPEDGPGGGDGSGSAGLPWELPVAVAAVLLALAGRYLALKRRRERLHGEDTNAAVIFAHRCYRRLAPWGGGESEELTALAGKARFSQHTLTEEERERAAQLLEEEAQRVAQALPGWRKPLFRVWWGRMEGPPAEK